MARDGDEVRKEESVLLIANMRCCCLMLGDSQLIHYMQGRSHSSRRVCGLQWVWSGVGVA